jgi:hypothetical protein
MELLNVKQPAHHWGSGRAAKFNALTKESGPFETLYAGAG